MAKVDFRAHARCSASDDDNNNFDALDVSLMVLHHALQPLTHARAFGALAEQFALDRSCIAGSLLLSSSISRTRFSPASAYVVLSVAFSLFVLFSRCGNIAERDVAVRHAGSPALQPVTLSHRIFNALFIIPSCARHR